MRRLCLTVCNGVKLQKLIRDRKGVCWLGHVYTIWFFGPLGWFGLEGASLCAACASVCWDGLEYDHHRKHAAGISCTCFVVICWGGVQKVGVFAKVLIRHSWLNRHGCILLFVNTLTAKCFGYDRSSQKGFPAHIWKGCWINGSWSRLGEFEVAMLTPHHHASACKTRSDIKIP